MNIGAFSFMFYNVRNNFETILTELMMRDPTGPRMEYEWMITFVIEWAAIIIITSLLFSIYALSVSNFCDKNRVEVNNNGLANGVEAAPGGEKNI